MEKPEAIFISKNNKNNFQIVDNVNIDQNNHLLENHLPEHIESDNKAPTPLDGDSIESENAPNVRSLNIKGAKDLKAKNIHIYAI